MQIAVEITGSVLARRLGSNNRLIFIRTSRSEGRKEIEEDGDGAIHTFPQGEHFLVRKLYNGLTLTPNIFASAAVPHTAETFLIPETTVQL